MRPSRETKKISLPSRLHVGCCPPAVETRQDSAVTGNRRTKISVWPGSSELYVIQCPSAEKCGERSSNSECRMSSGFELLSRSLTPTSKFPPICVYRTQRPSGETE